MGRACSLGWLRNRADRWDHILRDAEAPAPIVGATLDLTGLGLGASEARVFWPWPQEEAGSPTRSGAVLRFPAFRHGLLSRLIHSHQSVSEGEGQ